MKSGSASIDRHEETQAPHWMQATDWVTSTIASAGTMYSRSGGGPLGSSHGVTRRNFSQWVDSMSVTRSLITGMFPIGSTVISTGSPSSARDSRAASAAASPIWVLQARVDCPLILTPQDPQIAARHEQRTASVPSWSSLACRRPSSTERVGLELDVEALPVGAPLLVLGCLRLEAANLERVCGHLVGPLLRLPVGDRHR